MDFPQKIMIIEDEVITQRYLKDILGQYQVERADCYDNARDALTQIRANSYDMVLMDINIKGSMDGIQLAREILRNHIVPIIFITAHNDSETFQEVLELSPYGFIAKPFSSSDVEVAIQLAYKQYMDQKEAENKATASSGEIENIEISEQYTYSRMEHKLYCEESEVKLNSKQSKLVEILSENLNSIVRYDTLIEEIWENHEIADSALRTLVYTLRKAYPELPIVSHSKQGYSLRQKKDA